jgi:parvulin-like peptidyl-prolyl isomerase
MTEGKVNLTECYLMNDSLAKTIAERARKGENLATLATEYTQREGARDRKGLLLAQSPKSSKLAQKVTATTKVGDIIGPFPIDAGWSVIRYDGPVAPQQKSFDDALAELAPAYQDALQKRLTESWLSGVRVKHPVVYSTKALDGIWGATKTSRSKN